MKAGDIDPDDRPTQAGPRGLRFDFNDGCRLFLPESDHLWGVRLSDLDTGNVLYEIEIKAGSVNSTKRYHVRFRDTAGNVLYETEIKAVNSTKRYYVRFRLEVWQQGECVLLHDYCAADREVLIHFPVAALGDTIGWFPYAVKFKERHGCRLTCAIDVKLIPLFRGAYPDITFVDANAVQPASYYATYEVAIWFVDGAIYDHKHRVPYDFRLVGLHRAAAYILGVDPAETPPRIALADRSRPIAEPYVCIAVQSTMRAKYWNNPTGWSEVVAFLKHAGYRIVCIDQKRRHGHGLVWTQMPEGVEDQTGDQPLLERARWLANAEFFVGLSSGLSWLAWASGIPVVMISGFTHPMTEFATPFRVINYYTCNSCWNDPQHGFDLKDFLWCPRHKDTPRQFECTRLITAYQVIQTIRRIPGFGLRNSTRAARILHGDDDPDAAALDVARALVRSGNVEMMLTLAPADELAKAPRPLVRDSIRRRGAAV